MKKMFTDKVNVFNDGNKTLISVRDGFQEYLGAEIGLAPYGEVHRVYRSPDTIRELSTKLDMIPVVDGHIELEEIPQQLILGYISSSKIVDYLNNNFDATIAIQNEIKSKDNLIQLVNGKNELSLGYFADTKEHEVYTLEQVDIVPHHLAIVEAGRCGTICKFQDERTDGMKKKFVDATEQVPADEVENTPENSDVEQTDENGVAVEETKDQETPVVNLAKVSEIVADLPNAIKAMDIAELTKLIPILEEAIAKAKANMPQEANEEMEEAEEVGEEVAEGEMTDEEMNEEEMTDECSSKKENFADSKEFKDAVMQFADKRVATIMKAKTFLDEGYDFTKDCKTIMRDAIATQSNEQFKDEELDVAFKMLSKNQNYKNFADAKADELDVLKDKEL